MFSPSKVLKLHTAALLALAALGLASPSAKAQTLTYTLSSVTFEDGALASGTITYNATTRTVVDYNVTTTNGMTGPLIGASYRPANSQAVAFPGNGFQITTNPVKVNNSSTHSGSSPKVQEFSMLVLNLFPFATAPGVYQIWPGNVLTSPLYQLQDSGEFATNRIGARALRTGVVVVTEVPVTTPPPAPAPTPKSGKGK